MGSNTNLQTIKKLAELEAKSHEFEDQIKVINNKVDAMSKLYAQALSALRIKEQSLPREVKDESSVPKKKTNDRRETILPTKGSTNIRHRDRKEKSTRSNKSRK